MTYRLQSLFRSDGVQHHDVAQGGEEAQEGQDHAQGHLAKQVRARAVGPPLVAGCHLVQGVPENVGDIGAVGQVPLPYVEPVVEVIQGSWRLLREARCREIHGTWTFARAEGQPEGGETAEGGGLGIRSHQSIHLLRRSCVDKSSVDNDKG